MQVDWLERWYLGTRYSSIAVIGGLDDDLGGVGEHDLAGVLGERDLAGVDRGAVLHARAHVRGGGVEQRHGLALHVRAHEGAVGVVVLEERNERGGATEIIWRGGDVHVVDLLGGPRRGAERAVEVARTGDDRVRATRLPSASVVTNSCVSGSNGVLAGAMMWFSSSSAVIQSICR